MTSKSVTFENYSILYKSNKCFHFYIKNNNGEAYDDCIVYIFDNNIPFFVCLGNGATNMVLKTNILFIYYYENNEIFNLNTDICHWKDSIDIICNNILDYYENNNIITSNKIGMTLGYCLNIGHTYWNEISGFKFLIDLNLIDFIDTFIIGPYDYFNIYKILEKHNKNIIYEKNITNINNIINTNNLLMIKYNDFYMYKETKNLILENNIFLDKFNEKNLINSIKEKYYPIITINFRAVYRYLYNQEEIISNIYD